MDRYQTIINHILLRSVDCKDISLYHGKMGIVLALYLNAREQGKAEWEDWAWDLLQSVYAQLAENLPYDMEDGLVGIGYAVTLLKKNGIFDEDPNKQHKKSGGRSTTPSGAKIRFAEEAVSIVESKNI